MNYNYNIIILLYATSTNVFFNLFFEFILYIYNYNDIQMW